MWIYTNVNLWICKYFSVSKIQNEPTSTRQSFKWYFVASDASVSGSVFNLFQSKYRASREWQRWILGGRILMRLRHTESRWSAGQSMRLDGSFESAFWFIEKLVRARRSFHLASGISVISFWSKFSCLMRFQRHMDRAGIDVSWFFSKWPRWRSVQCCTDGGNATSRFEDTLMNSIWVQFPMESGSSRMAFFVKISSFKWIHCPMSWGREVSWHWINESECRCNCAWLMINSSNFAPWIKSWPVIRSAFKLQKRSFSRFDSIVARIKS